MAQVFSEGTKAVVLRGRRAGEVVSVTKVVGATFVQAKDAKGKERRFNKKHLEPA